MNNKKKIDMTQGPIMQLVVLFALPICLGIGGEGQILACDFAGDSPVDTTLIEFACAVLEFRLFF